MVIGIPPCTYSPQLMTMKRHQTDQNVYKRQLVEAKALLDFSLEDYEKQLREGGHFLHAHPSGAKSWNEPRVKTLLGHSKVRSVVAHLCQYGMTTGCVRRAGPCQKKHEIHELVSGDSRPACPQMRWESVARAPSGWEGERGGAVPSRHL